jgi:hypothetical protein
VSFDPLNKYGFGIYFLDNPNFYKEKFKEARLVKIKPKVKRPLIFTYHNRLSPCLEYSMLLVDLYNKKEIKDRDDLNFKLLEFGFDSIVAYETVGIYLNLLKEDDTLYDVIFDLDSKQATFGNKKENNEFKDIILNLINDKYKDINEYQGQILLNNFYKNLDNFFIPAKTNLKLVEELYDKGYLKRDSEMYEAYILDNKGIDFINDVVNYNK